ncbi:MAG TPA: hypothetical protein VFG12_03780, partial [Rhodopila sp.]|nr:hypothetical protein [Rhodopila sp.]
MEEILASIRRILNDDEAPAEAVNGAGTPEDDVLMLDESMLVVPPVAAPPVAAPAPQAAVPAAGETAPGEMAMGET